MGNLGITEILLIGAALLLFFGPSKLPQLGKSLGQGIQEFKKAAREISSTATDDLSKS
jgi:sec-independent protein translocase protein TatA